MAPVHIKIYEAIPKSRPGPTHSYITNMTISSDENMSDLKDAVLRNVDKNDWKKNSVYIECIRAGDEEEDGFFLEDKNALRGKRLSNVGKLVLWRKSTIDKEVKNLTDFVTENTGFVGKISSSAGGATICRKFSEVATGIADIGLPVYFQHLLFARKAKAQAEVKGNGFVKNFKVSAGFTTNWMGLLNSQM